MVEIVIIYTLYFLYNYDIVFLLIINTYILLYGFVYMNIPLKAKNVVPIQKTGKKIFLVSRKSINDMGHSFIAYIDFDQRYPVVNTISNLPVLGVSHDTSHELKTIKELLSGNYKNVNYKYWELDDDTYESIFELSQKYEKKFNISCLGLLIPIPINGSFLLSNCSTFSASFINEIVKTNFIGMSPLHISSQLNKHNL